MKWHIQLRLQTAKTRTVSRWFRFPKYVILMGIDYPCVLDVASSQMDEAPERVTLTKESAKSPLHYRPWGKRSSSVDCQWRYWRKLVPGISYNTHTSETGVPCSGFHRTRTPAEGRNLPGNQGLTSNSENGGIDSWVFVKSSCSMHFLLRSRFQTLPCGKSMSLLPILSS